MEFPESEDVAILTLRWIDVLAAEAGVTLILDSGTLLGLARDGTRIPHDDDVDLAVCGMDAMDRLRQVLDPGEFHVWRYAGQPYKLEIPERDGGPWLPVEVKVFQNGPGGYVCPAIGARRRGGKGVGPAAPLRGLVRPLWQRFLSVGDAARFPHCLLTRVDHWAVPNQFFDKTKRIDGMAACVVPDDLDGYLTYRYGNWRVPVQEWVSWRDDGGYRFGPPA